MYLHTHTHMFLYTRLLAWFKLKGVLSVSNPNVPKIILYVIEDVRGQAVGTGSIPCGMDKSIGIIYFEATSPMWVILSARSRYFRRFSVLAFTRPSSSAMVMSTRNTLDSDRCTITMSDLCARTHLSVLKDRSKSISARPFYSIGSGEYL